MNNSDAGAFATAETDCYTGSYGLTKREYFAGLALNGLLSRTWSTSTGPVLIENHAIAAAKLADALLAELEKQK